MKICQSVYFRLREVSPLDHGLGQFLIFTCTFVVQTWHAWILVPPINGGDWKQTEESDFTALSGSWAEHSLFNGIKCWLWVDCPFFILFYFFFNLLNGLNRQKVHRSFGEINYLKSGVWMSDIYLFSTVFVELRFPITCLAKLGCHQCDQTF